MALLLEPIAHAPSPRSRKATSPRRLALLRRSAKSLPLGCGLGPGVSGGRVPVGRRWLDEVRRYEREVLAGLDWTECWFVCGVRTSADCAGLVETNSLAQPHLRSNLGHHLADMTPLQRLSEIS